MTPLRSSFRTSTLQLLLLAVLAAISLAVAGCSKSPGASAADNKADEATEITVAAAEERRVERTAEVVGSLVADEEVQISNDVAGFLAAVHVDLGSRVQKGQLLAEMDRRDFETRVQQARAALAQVRARLGLAEGQDSVNPEDTTMVRQARAAMEDARSKYESAQKLIQTGDIPQQRFVELEKAYNARQAGYEAAVEDVRSQFAQLQARKADLALAEKQLADATIKAPVSGSVTAKLVSAGQYIKEKVPLLVLVKDDVLRLRAQVPESAASAIRVGQDVSFITDAFPGRTFSAQVTRISTALDARARTLVAEANVPNAERVLKPGMFARVTVVVEKDSLAVTVPRAALYEFAGLTKMFVVEGDRVKELRVQPGMSQDNWVEIPGGAIRRGALVATNNLDRLEDGNLVKIRR